MLKPKLIFGSPGIFFEDNAPAVYPVILDKLGRGEKARAIQEKYEEGKISGSLLLPEMIKLFLGICQYRIHQACRQYCFEFMRRGEGLPELFLTLQGSSHECVFVTSLPKEICINLWDIACGQSRGVRCISSKVSEDSEDSLIALDRESRTKEALGWAEYKLDPSRNSLFRNWEDVLVVGNSLTDIPLGKVVQEKGGRFIAFHGDVEVVNAANPTYGVACTLEEAFRWEGLL